MRVCTLGDLLLDVIVQPSAPLAPGDDVVASTRIFAGGQAANVAAWIVELGGSARLVGGRGDDASGRLAGAELAARGVELAGPVGGRTGVVVALLGADRDRSMASDRGVAADLSAGELDPAWFADCDWLHVSGYMLSTEAGAATAAEAARLARDAGARVSVDAASATLVGVVGCELFAGRIAALEPELLFATTAEHAALDGAAGAPTTVVKRGARGCTILRDGRAEDHAAVAATAVDSTGAGDAFAAGWLLGGPELALAAGARCVARLGAMP
jgi:sugar/nucleoside kinase (ribokinase family)